MTPYTLRQDLVGQWVVEADDDDGNPHVTVFIGPLAKERAECYCDAMNGVNNKHLAWPHE